MHDDREEIIILKTKMTSMEDEIERLRGFKGLVMEKIEAKHLEVIEKISDLGTNLAGQLSKNMLKFYISIATIAIGFGLSAIFLYLRTLQISPVSLPSP